MAERRERVETVRVNYVCDKCSKGNMELQSQLATCPPSYVHKCSNEDCSDVMTLETAYPTIRHVDYKTVNYVNPYVSMK